MREANFVWRAKLSVAKRLKRRKRHLIILVIVSFILSIAYALTLFVVEEQNYQLSTLTNLITMVLSALISTLLAIHVTKGDIMENDYAEKKDDFGVITFEEGYNKVFTNQDSITYLKISSWADFFDKAINSDKKIYIAGVSLTGFFDDKMIRNRLIELSDKYKCKVYIILANPYSQEVLHQSEAEDKPTREHIKNRIINTYQYFISDIKKYYKDSPENVDNFYKNFHILFSLTMPKALIFRAGGYMVVTPYTIGSAVSSPTIIAESSKNFAFYNKYDDYLETLIAQAVPYETLRCHIPAHIFFDQNYQQLSEEFNADFSQSKSLIVVGMRQKTIIDTFMVDVQRMISAGGFIKIVLCDPDGESTRMCAERSVVNKDTNSTIVDHKAAINAIIMIKNGSTNPDRLSIYKWDVLPPYTIFAFNTDLPGLEKIYVWINNPFEESKYRPGFVLSYDNDPEYVESYVKQLNSIVRKAKIIETPYRLE